MALLSSCLLLLFIASTLGNGCPRTNKRAQRQCGTSCLPSTGCADGNEKCICDGECGYSCVKKGLCNKISQIQNGVTRRHSTIHGAKATFYCRRGHRLIGKPKITCYFGNWSDSIPTCTVVNCGDPGSPVNGKTIANNGYIFGKKVSFLCDNGYVLKGGSFAICRYSGKWSKDLPKCQALCTKLPQILNGITRPHRTMHGAKASFYCKRGYKMIGKSKMTCNNGTWSDSLPKCAIVNCGDPGNLVNGKAIANNGHTYNNKVLFLCNSGFILRGNPSAICKENGKWSKVLPRCQALCMKLQHIPNGITSRHSTRHGAKASFSCRRGYQLIGKRKITCNDGTWSDNPPKCAVIKCGNPGRPINGNTIANNGYGYNKKVSFSCNHGYILKGSPFAICRPNGRWSKVVPKCSALCTQLSHIPNGFTKRHSGRHGSKVSFYCKKGFKLTGQTKITCYNGTWSDPRPKCTVVNCGDPGSPLNGKKIANNGYSYGENVSFSCDDGYVLKGSPLSLCRHNGKWSKKLPKCTALCIKIPKIKDGFTGRHSGRHGSKVSFSCSRGYNMTGKSKITCYNGTWSHSLPKCTVVHCGDPGSPINGKTIATNGHTYGKNVSFLCNDGYVIRGSRIAICRHHGKWSKKLPKCSAPCSKLPQITNGFVGNRGTRPGSKAWFFCRNGYQLVGNSTITCNDGSWSGSVPKCTRKVNSLTNDKVNGN